MRRSACPALLLLAACATDPAAVSETWNGATYPEVAAIWGQPTGSSKDADGNEMHVWRNEAPSGAGSSMSIGFGGIRGGGGVGVGVGTGVTVPVGPPPAPLVCERRMFFSNGVVVDQQWNGDPHYCATFKRR
jgi:hypothetical protein